jgi:hypothetical protein
MVFSCVFISKKVFVFFKKISNFKGTEVSKYGQICKVFAKGDVMVEGGKPSFQFLVQICTFGFSQGWGSVSARVVRVRSIEGTVILDQEVE